MTETVITDDNLHIFIFRYFRRDNPLPDDLKRLPIGKWDVSRVTDFDRLFHEQADFNEPLEWDTSNAVTMKNMFSGCEKFNQPLKWNVKKVENMSGMFYRCKAFNQPLEWETDRLTDTSYMFFRCKSFNQPLNLNMKKVKTINNMFYHCEEFNQPLPWDVSQVENMAETFDGCSKFNQPLRWDVSKVNMMEYMFRECIHFNGKLTGTSTPEWDVRKVVNMAGMFKECDVFNQPLDWDTQKLIDTSDMFMSCEKLNKPIRMNMKEVRDMEYMFSGCNVFNQPLEFDVSKVESMENLFQDCYHFNQTLRWDVSNVGQMLRMFAGCQRFNSPLIGITGPHWDVSKVFDMSEMFEHCHIFNQPLIWNVENVEFMYNMFGDCREFNQPLAWNIDKIQDCSRMFVNATAFNQDLTHWDITDVIEKESMFSGCGIEARNLPRGIEHEVPVATVPPVDVNAFQIHEFSSKVDIERLNAFFRSKTTLQPEKVAEGDIAGVLYTKLTDLIQQLETYAIEQEEGKLKELNTLDHSIKEIDIKSLGVPLAAQQTLEALFKTKKDLLDKIHTSKQLTKPIHYTKKIERLMSTATMKRKEELEREKELLVRIEQVDNEIKKVRLDKNKKDKLMVLLEERDNSIILSGRKKLLEYEIKNERDKIVKHRKDLDRIMKNILTRIKFYHFSPPWRLSTMYALDYVERQSLLFKKAYVEAFLKDCVNAYEGAAGMSCATGVMERFVVSLMAGCGTVLSVSENPEYEYIKGIVENGLSKLIPEYILKWYKLHSHGSYRFTTETREERLDNLKQYLLSFFPENEELILTLIPQYAIDVDNDDFAYKKENSAERINMNEVYASSSPKSEPKPTLLSRLTRIIPRPRQTKKNNLNRLRKTIANRKSKAKPKPRTKSRTKKTFKLGPVIGTAFG